MGDKGDKNAARPPEGSLVETRCLIKGPKSAIVPFPGPRSGPKSRTGPRALARSKSHLSWRFWIVSGVRPRYEKIVDSFTRSASSNPGRIASCRFKFSLSLSLSLSLYCPFPLTLYYWYVRRYSLLSYYSSFLGFLGQSRNHVHLGQTPNYVSAVSTSRLFSTGKKSFLPSTLTKRHVYTLFCSQVPV